MWSLKKNRGWVDLEQMETYEKLKNRGWYSKWYWYFNNAITSNDITKMIILLLVLLLLLLTTNESNNCDNYNNNNALIIKTITIKMESGCALKWKMTKSSYIYYSPHFLFAGKNAPCLYAS